MRTITANSPRVWANTVRIRLTRRADDPTRFRLEVLHQPSNNAVVESFENLPMTASDARFAQTAINGRSAFVSVSAATATTPGDAA